MTEQLKPTTQHRALFTVPRGTKSSVCRGPSCRAEIFWIEQRFGVRTPVDVDVPGGQAPSEDRDGIGVSHFQTCPDAGKFSKNRRR